MIYMGSTKIEPEKTVSEIMKLLSRQHVKRIMTIYEDGQIIGLTFSITHGQDELPFKLPVRWEPVLKTMAHDKHTPRNLCIPAQAKRTAWRLILRWVEAQLALVEINMADIKEIFMPYLITSEGTTLYQMMEAKSFPALKQNNQ